MKANKQMKRTKSINLKKESSGDGWKRLFASQGFISFIALVLLISLTIPLARSYTRRLVAEKEINDMRSKIMEVEKVNKELEELIAYSISEQAAEEHARGSYNLKKPGEVVYQIEDESLLEESETEEDKLKNESPWKLWWSYFFK